MIDTTILGPAAVLALWTLVMLGWLTVTRFAAFSKAGITLGTAPVGSRYADVEGDMPMKVNWISHNYTHLVEQPTVFYAVVITLALIGDGSSVSVGAAWAYAGLRIAHSLWQSLVNVISVRVLLFTLSTVCLWVLAVRAVMQTVM